MNDAVKAFIASEVLLWSAWNFVIPIVSVFVVDNMAGGSIQLASFAFTTYLISRMIFELYASRRISGLSTAQRAIIDIAGMIVLSVAYLALAIQPTIAMLFVFYITVGFGFGISSPAKLSLFSSNLERQTEARVWGVYDVAILSGMALATAVGGLIAGQFGFKTLFLLSAVVNIIGVVPYLFFIRLWRHRRQGSSSA